MQFAKKKQVQYANEVFIYNCWLAPKLGQSLKSPVVQIKIKTLIWDAAYNLKVPWHATRCGVISCYKQFWKSAP